MSEVRKAYSDKLSWEWHIFCRDMTNTSRENLFCMAGTIAAKKKIYDILSETDEFTEDELCSLLRMEHMIDTLYMKLSKKKAALQVTDIKQALL